MIIVAVQCRTAIRFCRLVLLAVDGVAVTPLVPAGSVLLLRGILIVLLLVSVTIMIITRTLDSPSSAFHSNGIRKRGNVTCSPRWTLLLPCARSSVAAHGTLETRELVNVV